MKLRLVSLDTAKKLSGIAFLRGTATKRKCDPAEGVT